MTSPLDSDLEKRIADIEATLGSMQLSLDSIARALNSRLEQSAEPVNAPATGRRADPSNASTPAVAPRPGNAGQARPVARPSVRRAPAPPGVPDTPAWYSGRSPEWWLGGLGIVFLLVGLLLLYRYAVDHNWITPLVRVLTGVVIGAGLVAGGIRLTVGKPDEDELSVGLREILLSGGIAVWYITSYAAAIYYQLISIPSARTCFLALSVAAAWLALKERRLAFAIIAVGVGFAAPFLMPSPPGAVIGLVLYLAPLAAVGAILYLMRGWQSVLWISFIGFLSALPVFQLSDLRWFPSTGINSARIVMTLTIIAFGVAFTRVPIMRRRLLATGSELYKPSSVPDVPVAWIMTLATPLITLILLSWTWPRVQTEFWAVAAIAFGSEAYRLSRIENQPDANTAHIEAAAAVLWTLCGLLALVPSFSPRFVMQIGPLFLGVAVLHSALAIYMVPRREFMAARRIAKITALICFATVVIYEVSHV